MKRFERATAILAVAAGIAAGAPAVKAEAAPSQAKAMKVAKKISSELYDTKDFPKGVPVPGILNGSVQIAVNSGTEKYTVRDEHPIVLVESHSAAATEKNPQLLDGSWLGMPNAGLHNHVVITPYPLELGNPQSGETVTLHLANNHQSVLEGAGVYAKPSGNGPDNLYAFDLDGNAFGKFLIQTVGVQ